MFNVLAFSTAPNKQICGSGHTAFTQIEAYEEVKQGQSVLLIGKTSFKSASTSHIRQALYERIIKELFLEFWDIYDQKGNKTDKLHSRGEQLKSGDFHMVVENWIKNNKGEYLIQKRTKPLRNFFNPWSTTAGSAIKGESSIIAVQRETHEEMGLYFEFAELNFIKRSFFDDFFMDVYETIWNGKIEDVIFDPYEVSEVKWVCKSVLQKMYKTQEFYTHNTEYLQEVLNYSIV